MGVDSMIYEIHIEALQLNKLLLIFTIFVLLDIITGVIGAIIEKTLNSSVFKKGLYGKFLEMVIITISILLYKLLGLPKEVGLLTCIFYVCQEGLSILENTSKYISYPHFIKDIFKKINECKGNNDEK